MRQTFPAVIALNVAMLASTLYSGDHYLADILGGTLIAVVAMAAEPIVNHFHVDAHRLSVAIAMDKSKARP